MTAVLAPHAAEAQPAWSDPTPGEPEPPAPVASPPRIGPPVACYSTNCGPPAFAPPSDAMVMKMPAPEADFETDYTLQIALADAASLGLLLAGAHSEGTNGEDSDSTGLYYATGAIGALSIAPIIHASHRQGLRAAASFGLRQALPLIGLLVQLEANQGCDEFLCQLDGVGPAMFAGLVAASVIDIAVLSHGSTLARHRVQPHTLLPVLAPMNGGAQAGVAMSF